MTKGNPSGFLIFCHRLALIRIFIKMLIQSRIFKTYKLNTATTIDDTENMIDRYSSVALAISRNRD